MSRSFPLGALRLIIFVVFSIINVRNLSSLDRETHAILNDCAEKNTCFLQKKISPESLQRFKDCIPNLPDLRLALFSFTESSGWSAVWSPYAKAPRVNTYLEWLKKNYKPQSDFSFFLLTVEPYAQGHCMPQKTQNKLNELLDGCPLLIPCNHPDLAWTKKGVLIPDVFMIEDSFHRTIEDLLTSKMYGTIEDLAACSVKGFVPFSQRASKVYFRGALNGPKLPYNLRNVKENPRQHLLWFTTTYPYLDVGVTNFVPFLYEQKGLEYLGWVFNNYWRLQCSPVDFFEHAKNKYLLSCDGLGAAWSRVEYIMATGSILFLNAQCEQYFYSLMENNKTHTRITTDFSNLNDEFQRLENDPALAEKIGTQGKKFAQQFFSKEAVDTYMKLVLNKLEKCGTYS